MNAKLREQAETLAAEPYTVETRVDETTRGDSIYLLSHPELPGCMAQGQTVEEATINLADATTEYILSLLEDGLPVPPPMVKATVTMPSLSNTYIDDYSSHQESSFLDDLSNAVQSAKGHRLGTVSLVEVG